MLLCTHPKLSAPYIRLSYFIYLSVYYVIVVIIVYYFFIFDYLISIYDHIFTFIRFDFSFFSITCLIVCLTGISCHYPYLKKILVLFVLRE